VERNTRRWKKEKKKPGPGGFEKGAEQGVGGRGEKPREDLFAGSEELRAEAAGAAWGCCDFGFRDRGRGFGLLERLCQEELKEDEVGAP